MRNTPAPYPETFMNRAGRSTGTRVPFFRVQEDDMKIALYARVSRNDGVQDVENQLHELRNWAARLGGEVVAEYIDQVSGTKTGDARPALQQALQASHERRHDLLLVWSLDRLSRGGVLALAGILERVQRSGVVLKSLRESWLDMSSPLVAELLVSIFAWIARQEREQLIARTKAGMYRAKRQGVHVGRPRLEISAERARMAVERAGSVRAAARLLRCDEGTIRNRLAS
jgi:DNA invertase Pin-like site-specific DNA recombinase